MVGSVLVKFAFVSCFLSILAYLQHHRSGASRFLLLGRSFYIVTVGAVIGISAFMLNLILTHQFQYTYVWSYSSRALPLPLLISTFYAGQEGSFMLWTLYTGIIGLFLVMHSRKKGYEAQVMSIFGLIELSLLLMLLVKNPFMLAWETWPGQIQAGFMPADGRGLNPLLQNYWMVIHPQVLFSGFASMGVPYAYAIAAMMKRDYRDWIRPVTPWLAFGALVLGTGIIMGGFWAYETLGWGGYWAWDPVENSSLVPWLFAIASIHMILSQRKTGGFIRTNLVLGMMCFLMVLYSTFLTRSGVLGDTSVHSFVDPGMAVYWLLVGIIIFFAGLGIAMYVIHRKEIPKPAIKHTYYSREFALFLGSSAIVAAAVFIIIGTSSPLITDIFQGKKSAVDISYYVTTTLPLGIAIGILAGIGQLFWWTKSNLTDLLKSLVLPASVALAVTLALLFFIQMEILVGCFLFAAAFALAANVIVGIRIMKGNPKFAGGSIAHIGLAIMFFGFVASSKYDQKATVSLAQGKTSEVMGYKLTYTGYEPIDKEKYLFRVKVEKDGRAYSVAPVMYYSAYNDGLMRNPDIVNLISKDFYLAPMALEQKSDAEAGLEKVEFKRGQTKTVGGLQITFVDFDFPVMQKAAMLEGKDVAIGAVLEVKEQGKPPRKVVPAKIMHQGESSDRAVMLDDRFEFTIAGMRPDRESKENSSVEIGLRNMKAAAQTPKDGSDDVLVAEASVKPFINLVWSGVIVLLLGFLVTVVRRGQEARLKEIEPEAD